MMTAALSRIKARTRGMEEDAEPMTPPPDPSRSSLPQQVGQYKVLEILGEGGMGIVYLAEQEKPVRRRVALKLIKLGMDTQEVIARFETERQALAIMNHPDIARIFDAGATDVGRPYFIMEHVTGILCGDRERDRLKNAPCLVFKC